MMGEATGRQNSDSKGGRKENKQTTTTNKKKRMVILLHTQAITETKSCLGEGRGGREGGWWGWDQREAEEEEEERGEARGSPGNKTFSLCVYDACQTNDKWPKTFFLVVKIWGVVTKKKKKIYLYDKPTEGGGGGGEPGGSICKMCVFFSVVFFIFYDNYLFSLGMYWINVCTCSVPSWSSFELVLKVNMKHWK